MKNYSKGFTIIELIITIGIITIIASIIVINVTQYLNRSKNDSITENMNTIATNASIYFESSNTYIGFGTGGYAAPFDAITALTGVTPGFITDDTGQLWCSCTVLLPTIGSPASSTFCVDSNGYKKITAGLCAARCSATSAPLAQCT